MPTAAYIEMKGRQQGLMTTNSCSEDSIGTHHQQLHDQELIAHEISHVVTVPTDPLSGQPSGQRVHKPFTFTTPLCHAVPNMYSALSSGEQLEYLYVNFWRTASRGEEEKFFRIEIIDGTIVDMDLYMPHVLDPKSSDYTQLVKVSVAYAEIHWNHLIQGPKSEDKWIERKGH